MATSYVRLRVLWGALDVTAAQGQTPTYAPAQIVSGGASAAAGSGVGVRRVTLNIDRTAVEGGMDPAVMHFDILNTTSGSPDDTWVTADYTTVEGQLDLFDSSIRTMGMSGHKVSQYIWHRVGSGVSKPNPAERVTDRPGALAWTGGPGLPAQCASSITFRTGVRRSWGRTYLPLGANAMSGVRLGGGSVDTIAAAANALVTGLATADMHLVVVSAPLASSLNVEHVEVDNVPDIQRRRRPKKQTYRKILPP
jgi:hypothetical protein